MSSAAGILFPHRADRWCTFSDSSGCLHVVLTTGRHVFFQRNGQLTAEGCLPQHDGIGIGGNSSDSSGEPVCDLLHLTDDSVMDVCMLPPAHGSSVAAITTRRVVWIAYTSRASSRINFLPLRIQELPRVSHSRGARRITKNTGTTGSHGAVVYVDKDGVAITHPYCYFQAKFLSSAELCVVGDVATMVVSLPDSFVGGGVAAACRTGTSRGPFHVLWATRGRFTKIAVCPVFSHVALYSDTAVAVFPIPTQQPVEGLRGTALPARVRTDFSPLARRAASCPTVHEELRSSQLPRHGISVHVGEYAVVDVRWHCIASHSLLFMILKNPVNDRSHAIIHTVVATHKLGSYPVPTGPRAFSETPYTSREDGLTPTDAFATQLVRAGTIALQPSSLFTCLIPGLPRGRLTAAYPNKIELCSVEADGTLHTTCFRFGSQHSSFSHQRSLGVKAKKILQPLIEQYGHLEALDMLPSWNMRPIEFGDTPPCATQLQATRRCRLVARFASSVLASVTVDFAVPCAQVKHIHAMGSSDWSLPGSADAAPGVAPHLSIKSLPLSESESLVVTLSPRFVTVLSRRASSTEDCAVAALLRLPETSDLLNNDGTKECGIAAPLVPPQVPLDLCIEGAELVRVTAAADEAVDGGTSNASGIRLRLKASGPLAPSSESDPVCLLITFDWKRLCHGNDLHHACYAGPWLSGIPRVPSIARLAVLGRTLRPNRIVADAITRGAVAIHALPLGGGTVHLTIGYGGGRTCCDSTRITECSLEDAIGQETLALDIQCAATSEADVNHDGQVEVVSAQAHLFPDSELFVGALCRLSHRDVCATYQLHVFRINTLSTPCSASLELVLDDVKSFAFFAESLITSCEAVGVRRCVRVKHAGSEALPSDSPQRGGTDGLWASTVLMQHSGTVSSPSGALANAQVTFAARSAFAVLHDVETLWDGDRILWSTFDGVVGYAPIQEWSRSYGTGIHQASRPSVEISEYHPASILSLILMGRWSLICEIFTNICSCCEEAEVRGTSERTAKKEHPSVMESGIGSLCRTLLSNPLSTSLSRQATILPSSSAAALVPSGVLQSVLAARNGGTGAASFPARIISSADESLDACLPVALLERLSERLPSVELRGLDGQEQMKLLCIVETLKNERQVLSSLDNAALRLVFTWKLRQLQQRLRVPLTSTSAPFFWGTLSDASEQVLGMLCGAASSLPGVINPTAAPIKWSEVRLMGVPLWLASIAQLRAVAERLAKSEYQATQQVQQCALMYCLAGKVATLVALCKAKGDTKLQLFFARNFREEKNQAAATANAFAAISKNMIEYGAAFFLLANDVRSAALIVLQRTGDWMLGFLIARLGSNDSPTDLQWYRNEVQQQASDAAQRAKLKASLPMKRGAGSDPVDAALAFPDKWEVACMLWREGKKVEALHEVATQRSDPHALAALQYAAKSVASVSRRDQEFLPASVDLSLRVSAARYFCGIGAVTCAALAYGDVEALVEAAATAETQQRLRSVAVAAQEQRTVALAPSVPVKRITADLNSGTLAFRFDSDSDDDSHLAVPSAQSGATESTSSTTQGNPSAADSATQDVTGGAVGPTDSAPLCPSPLTWLRAEVQRFFAQVVSGAGFRAPQGRQACVSEGCPETEHVGRLIARLALGCMRKEPIELLRQRLEQLIEHVNHEALPCPQSGAIPVCSVVPLPLVIHVLRAVLAFVAVENCDYALAFATTQLAPECGLSVPEFLRAVHSIRTQLITTVGDQDEFAEADPSGALSPSDDDRNGTMDGEQLGGQTNKWMATFSGFAAVPTRTEPDGGVGPVLRPSADHVSRALLLWFQLHMLSDIVKAIAPMAQKLVRESHEGVSPLSSGKPGDIAFTMSMLLTLLSVGVSDTTESLMELLVRNDGVDRGVLTNPNGIFLEAVWELGALAEAFTSTMARHPQQPHSVCVHSGDCVFTDAGAVGSTTPRGANSQPTSLTSTPSIVGEGMAHSALAAPTLLAASVEYSKLFLEVPRVANLKRFAGAALHNQVSSRSTRKHKVAHQLCFWLASSAADCVKDAEDVWLRRHHSHPHFRNSLLRMTLSMVATPGTVERHVLSQCYHSILSIAFDRSSCDSIAWGTEAGIRLGHGFRDILAGDNDFALQRKVTQKNTATTIFSIDLAMSSKRYLSARPQAMSVSHARLAAHPYLPFYLAAHSNTYIDLYPFASPECVAFFTCRQKAFAAICTNVAFSPSGYAFGVGLMDGTVACWKFSALQCDTLPFLVQRVFERDSVKGVTFCGDRSSVLAVTGIGVPFLSSVNAAVDSQPSVPLRPMSLLSVSPKGSKTGAIVLIDTVFTGGACLAHHDLPFAPEYSVFLRALDGLLCCSPAGVLAFYSVAASRVTLLTPLSPPKSAPKVTSMAQSMYDNLIAIGLHNGSVWVISQQAIEDVLASALPPQMSDDADATSPEAGPQPMTCWVSEESVLTSATLIETSPGPSHYPVLELQFAPSALLAGLGDGKVVAVALVSSAVKTQLQQMRCLGST